jgi:nitroreductase
LDVIDALRARRSIGKLGGEVSEPEVWELLELAAWAPNHRLTEPWRFSVLRGSAREQLGAVWGNVAARETTFEGVQRDDLVRREAAKPLRAPLIIAVSVRTDPDPVVATEDFAATAAAVQNLLLAAHAKGLGAIWRTGRMAYRAETNAFLDLAADDRVVAFVYLGHPTIEPPPPKPRDVPSVVRFLA